MKYRQRWVLILFLSINSICLADESTGAFSLKSSPQKSSSTSLPTPSATNPDEVSLGIYLLDIYDLDLKRCTYTADFYIWLRWRGNVDPTKFEFVNGTMDAKEYPDRKEVSDTQYVSYRCRGTFHGQFDFRRYPLDSQLLMIEIEDADLDVTQLRYVADLQNMGSIPNITVAGWATTLTSYTVRDIVYKTNYGDPLNIQDDEAVYSRAVLSIAIERHSAAIYVKTFLALFISVAIAFLAFIVDPADLDPRFGVGIAAVFGAVSSQIVVSSNLPDIPYLTLSDKIHLLSLFFIFLSLLQSCLSLRLAHLGKVVWQHRLDRISMALFCVAYGTLVFTITALA